MNATSENLDSQAFLVRLRDVHKQFDRKGRAVLRAISADIPPGVITGIVGPDGAGKTTLLRLMAGLLDPTSGEILLNDSHKPGSRRGLAIGYMPQKFGLYEDLSVMENLTLNADLRAVVGREREEMFGTLLEFTDLKRFTNRLAGRLSGGMKQKLGLACTLLGRPNLLLLDEPGVGVDPISRRELWRLVNDLVKQGVTVVWSTAYLEEAEQCQHVLLLNEGSLLFAGKASELTERVQSRCFQLRGIAGSRRQVLTRALQQPQVLDGVIQGQSVKVLLRPGAKPPAASTLEAGRTAAWVPVPPRFEDAFIDVLGGEPTGESQLAHKLRAKPPNGGEPIAKAMGLTRRFGEFVAADRISFEVRPGEIFGLLGPNGAGKSTTFRMMCGLLAPTSGTAQVLGIDLQRSPSRARQQLGYMAQKFSLYGNLTAMQNLQFFSGAYGMRGAAKREAIDEMIEALKLQGILGTASDQLPLGFKQRLALACALMHRPDVVFLDEPTSGVDPITRREFWTHINGIVEKGVTVVVTTHFMDEAEYCDRIALIHRGRIIASGSPDDLKRLAVVDEHAEPTLEDAFIHLVQEEQRRVVA